MLKYFHFFFLTDFNTYYNQEEYPKLYFSIFHPATFNARAIFCDPPPGRVCCSTGFCWSCCYFILLYALFFYKMAANVAAWSCSGSFYSFGMDFKKGMSGGNIVMVAVIWRHVFVLLPLGSPAFSSSRLVWVLRAALLPRSYFDFGFLTASQRWTGAFADPIPMPNPVIAAAPRVLSISDVDSPHPRLYFPIFSVFWMSICGRQENKKSPPYVARWQAPYGKQASTEK